MENSSQIDLSIIICSWNNCKRLAVTLDIIRKCDIPNGFKWELVIVNNNSQDEIDNIVESFKKKLPIKYIEEPIQGLSRARNAGLSVASGKLILFTDDDIAPCRDWIVSYWSAFENHPNGFYFGGPIESEFERKPDERLIAVAPASIRGLYWGDSPRPLSRNEYFLSANWACPKKALDMTGGFNEAKGLNPSLKRISVGEEIELMERLNNAGFFPWYIPEAKLRHFVPVKKTTLEFILARRDAGARETARDILSNSRYRKVLGIPIWIYSEMFRLCFQILSKKLILKSTFNEYIRLRYLTIISMTIFVKRNLIS